MASASMSRRLLCLALLLRLHPEVLAEDAGAAGGAGATLNARAQAPLWGPHHAPGRTSDGEDGPSDASAQERAHEREAR
eukprot:CAMPEP_0176329824 /NCGR_PEP_ID=MMETSP0121_2-20121125/75688_1 /TAXON_ID=160619 /ORGANISM="Kryptoperidinium foliaceum, Strain CCMP 1326" /LENGTH=78 /DNA_ID=CAMNT_0017672559 /DNA_START=54 /DNA_END=286 /DNA_ORIENTATION=-